MLNKLGGVKYLNKPLLTARNALLSQTTSKERVNILITSAGKRVKLVRLFQQELRRYFPNGKVYTTDMNPMLAPAGYESDQCFQVPRVIDEHYPDRLLAICKENDVRVIIPTIDTELLVLAKYKTVVFINGCFWHGHAGCRYFVIPETRKDWWIEKINKNIERDNRANEALRSAGWNVIIVWECQLKPKQRSKTLADLAAKIRNNL